MKLSLCVFLDDGSISALLVPQAGYDYENELCLLSLAARRHAAAGAMDTGMGYWELTMVCRCTSCFGPGTVRHNGGRECEK